jgi:hypothetical protein
VVRRLPGRSRLGCLFALLLVTAGIYFGINIGEVFWKKLRYEDAMRQEVRFAQMRSDDAIARRLASVAESLGLPEAASRVEIRRDERSRRIVIRGQYSERVELPGFVRVFHFAPRAEGAY